MRRETKSATSSLRTWGNCDTPRSTSTCSDSTRLRSARSATSRRRAATSTDARSRAGIADAAWRRSGRGRSQASPPQEAAGAVVRTSGAVSSILGYCAGSPQHVSSSPSARSSIFSAPPRSSNGTSRSTCRPAERPSRRDGRDDPQDRAPEAHVGRSRPADRRRSSRHCRRSTPIPTNIASSPSRRAITTRRPACPSAFVAEQAQTVSTAQHAWIEARSQSDYAHFQPHLEQTDRAETPVHHLLSRAASTPTTRCSTSSSRGSRPRTSRRCSRSSDRARWS